MQAEVFRYDCSDEVNQKIEETFRKDVLGKDKRGRKYFLIGVSCCSCALSHHVLACCSMLQPIMLQLMLYVAANYVALCCSKSCCSMLQPTTCTNF